MPKLIFDTAVGSYNLGDHIIMDAVNQLAEELFPNDFLIQIPTHQWIHPLDLPALRKYDFALVGGTNLLKNDNLRYSQWKVGVKEVAVLRKKVILFGVGWWQYQEQPITGYSKFLYQNLLSDQYVHSVRDGYTAEKLASIGVRNVLNTGCPTVWELTDQHCAQINPAKQPVVVTTITDYKRDAINDRKMLETLKANYEEVHLWLQGTKDEEYIRQLCDGIQFIAPNLSAFDRFLEQRDCDYVGTRLHAGIRAMQKKRRSLIIGIDNRAIEMRRDINLHVLEREQMDRLASIIHEEKPIELNIDFNSIQQWKAQFGNLAIDKTL